MHQASVKAGRRSMSLAILSAVVAVALSPQAANGAEIIGTSGDWELFRDSKSCGMTRTYDGPGLTEMMVIKYSDGNIRILITNKGWSAKQDELYDVSYQLNGATYGGSKAVGTADDDRRGFVSTFVSGFGNDFAKGSTLRVFLSGKEIERLSLAGTGAALTMVDGCLTEVRTALSKTKREKEKRARLPKDPFASPSRDPER